MSYEYEASVKSIESVHQLDGRCLQLSFLQLPNIQSLSLFADRWEAADEYPDFAAGHWDVFYRPPSF